METKKDVVTKVLTYGFQKDLIVWKLSQFSLMSIPVFRFQKDLIVWKPDYFKEGLSGKK